MTFHGGEDPEAFARTRESPHLILLWGIAETTIEGIDSAKPLAATLFSEPVYRTR
jgi:hypothetical protein